MPEHILKAENFAKCELWCFSRNFPKIFRRAILKENLPMSVPYFIKEPFSMHASDEFLKLWITAEPCYR